MLRLFVWDHDGVLCDYTDGLIVAFARDVEHAKELVSIRGDGSYDSVKAALAHEPRELTEAEAIVVWGGS